MKNELFIKVEEIAKDLGISKPYAYKLTNTYIMKINGIVHALSVK